MTMCPSHGLEMDRQRWWGGRCVWLCKACDLSRDGGLHELLEDAPPTAPAAPMPDHVAELARIFGLQIRQPRPR